MPTPSSSDLRLYLQSSGISAAIITSLGSQFDGAILAAIASFESKTGRDPFIASSSDQDVLVDPPGDTSSSSTSSLRNGGEKRLELPVPFFSISAIRKELGSLSPSGIVLTENVDYFLRPQLYAIKGKPIEWIEFRSPVYGLSQSVKITGRPGSYADWPEDAKRAVIQMAAASLVANMMSFTLTGVSSWKEGDVEEKYDNDYFSKLRDVFLGEGSKSPSSVESVIARYRLVRVGL
jgi:hypothetical protein